MILYHTFTRNRDRAHAALRYYQMRPRGEDEPPRSLFTATEAVSRAEAYRLIDTHQARGYLAHRLMLSPSTSERPEDLQALTRYVMREMEKEHGETLHWVAVEHRNTDHPHVHILLRGGRERDGARAEVRLHRADHIRIKEDGKTYCEIESRERTRWEQALSRAAAQSQSDGHERAFDDGRGEIER